MVRFRSVLARSSVLAALLACVLAAPAHAHGIQGRADLPIPIRAFYWASAIVLVVSFVGLAVGWRRPLLATWLARTDRTWRVGAVARALLVVARTCSVALLLLVLATALLGSTDLNTNFAPIWVFVVWWIGIALLAATVGDWWRAVHPVAVLARLLGMPEESTGRLPRAAGIWIAFVGMLVFTWLELVYPTAANVRLLGLLAFAWTAGTLLAMRSFGIGETLDRVEPFAVYTRVLGHLGVVGRRQLGDTAAASDAAPGAGELQVRPPVLGLLQLREKPGLAAFLGLLIGSVSFDGLSRTLWWKQRVASSTVRLVEQGLEPQHAQQLLGTLGLVMMVSVGIGAFLAFGQLARIVGRLPRRTARFGSVAGAFAPSLVPIAFAYVVAHYVSFFWFQSQQVVRLASDPFGHGWDLFGTDGFEVDYGTLSANAIWIVQVTAIVVGHVVALVLAHDRALEIEAEAPGARGVRSQWPMLALMVLYTIGGLYFLSEGLNA